MFCYSFLISGIRLKRVHPLKNNGSTDAPVTNSGLCDIIFSEVVEMINKTAFGKFMREKRTEKGLTQKELAEKLFLSESAVSKWEMGKSYPDITMIPDICKVLDVSEHELISGANDSEYRLMKNEARLYRKVTETFFWGFTCSYAVALIICVICDLAINKRLTFSIITAGSLLVAFTFIPTCVRFTQKHKLALFAGSTYLSLSLLFLICCVYFRQNWFATAVLGTLLGYAVCFVPFLLKKYVPEKYSKFIPAMYFTVCFICLILLLLGVRITVEFSLAHSLLIVLFSMIPFAVTAIMQIVPANGFIKTAVDIFAFGVTLYGTQFCVNKILGINSAADYAVDFGNWQTCVNGNVYLIILISSLAASLAFVIAGIKRMKK